MSTEMLSAVALTNPDALQTSDELRNALRRANHQLMQQTQQARSMSAALAMFGDRLATLVAAHMADDDTSVRMQLDEVVRTSVLIEKPTQH